MLTANEIAVYHVYNELLIYCSISFDRSGA
jgi:hypothetical protein